MRATWGDGIRRLWLVGAALAFWCCVFLITGRHLEEMGRMSGMVQEFRRK